MSSTNTTEPATFRLLCVEDNPDDVELMQLALERADSLNRYELTRVDDASDFLRALEDEARANATTRAMRRV